MGAKGSRNYSTSYPRIRSIERSDASNSPNAFLQGYHASQNDFLIASNHQHHMHHQSRYHLNGSHFRSSPNSSSIPPNNVAVTGSTRLAYPTNSNVENFTLKENDIGFRNNFFDGTDKSHSKLSKRPPPSKSTLLQELLECPICMNLYDNPHVLPCQHTFCKKCLILMQNNEAGIKNTLDCPICREKHILPNGIEGLSANYTMKRLIELEAMAVEKEKEKTLKEKAKCFVCQKYSHLKVCSDCSYMLCNECLENPNHEILIECKLNSRKQNYGTLKGKSTNMRQVCIAKPPQPKQYTKSVKNVESLDLYSEIIHRNTDDKLKLILLCHSSIVELNQDKKKNKEENSKVYEDEHGMCKTFCKIIISVNDRIISLKKIVENKFGISCKDQILVYKDKILKSDLKPLNSFNIRQYSRIHIFDERDIKDNANDIGDDLYGIYQDADFEQPLNEDSNSKHELIYKQENNSSQKNDLNLKKEKSIKNQSKINSDSKTENFASSSRSSTLSCSSSTSSSTTSLNEITKNEDQTQKFKRNINYKTTYKYPSIKKDNFERADMFSSNRYSAIYGSTRNFNYHGYSTNPTRYRTIDEIFN